MRRIAAVISIFLAVLMASCSSTAHAGSHDNTRIEITLPENPPTGFSWIWGQMGAGHIEMVGETFVPGDGIGAPGEHTFIFAGTKPGHVTLTFSSRQPWDGGGIGDTEAFSVTVYDDMTISYL